jgi:purine-binding chemotaxis protein CheW
MAPKAQTTESCIIVVDVLDAELGIIVDRVSEVLSLSSDDIEPVPSFGKDFNTDFILGIGKSHSKVKILLNISRVLSEDDVAHLHATQTKKAERHPA